MPLKYVVKDLVQAAKDGDINALAHQANCMCTMKSGIAPQLANAFPALATADNQTVPGDRFKLGKMSYGYDTDYKLHLFNLYGQYDWRGRNNTEYDALDSALYIMEQKLPLDSKIGLPKLGAGLGGGDWEVISEIIENRLRHHEVTIYVLHGDQIPANAG